MTRPLTLIEYATLSGTTPVAEDPDRSAGAEALDLDEAKASRNLRNGLVSLAVLVLLVVGLLLAVPGLHGVAREVTHMPAGLVAAAIACEIFSCLGYVGAFLQVFERAPVRFGARVALAELAFGAAVSLGGAGSVAIGALLLVERGGPPARVAERSAVLFLLTSAINVLTLALAGLLTWTGVLPGSGDPLLTLVPGAVGLGAFLLFMALPALTARFVREEQGGKLAVAMRTTSEVVRETARYLFTPDWRTLGAVAFLWADIAVLAVCFFAIGTDPPLTTIVLAYQIGYLSNMLPIPGSIGVLDGSFVGLFVLYGVSATKATAATVVYHAIALWVPAMWGTFAFLLLRRSRGEPLQLRPSRAERRHARR